MSWPDMSLTIGEVIDNPTFNVDCDYAITDYDGEILYGSGDQPIPDEILVAKVAGVAIRDSMLLIEADMQEG